MLTGSALIQLGIAQVAAGTVDSTSRATSTARIAFWAVTASGLRSHRPMTIITTLLCVTDSGYWITEPTAHVEGLQTGGGNGLIWPGRGAATIATGLEDGPVRITVDARATEPPLNLEDWEEAIEVSIQFDTDEADLESLGGTVDETRRKHRCAQPAQAGTASGSTPAGATAPPRSPTWNSTRSLSKSTSSRPGQHHRRRRSATR